MWSEDHWFGPDLIGAEKWGNENVSLAEPFHLDLCKSAFSTGLITASAGTGKHGAKRVGIQASIKVSIVRTNLRMVLVTAS